MKYVISVAMLFLVGCGSKPVKQVEALPEPPQPAKIHDVVIDPDADLPLTAERDSAAEPVKPPALPPSEAVIRLELTKAETQAAKDKKLLEDNAARAAAAAEATRIHNEEFNARIRNGTYQGNRQHTSRAESLGDAQARQVRGR